MRLGSGICQQNTTTLFWFLQWYLIPEVFWRLSDDRFLQAVPDLHCSYF